MCLCVYLHAVFFCKLDHFMYVHAICYVFIVTLIILLLLSFDATSFQLKLINKNFSVCGTVESISGFMCECVSCAVRENVMINMHCNDLYNCYASVTKTSFNHPDSRVHLHQYAH